MSERLYEVELILFNGVNTPFLEGLDYGSATCAAKDLHTQAQEFRESHGLSMGVDCFSVVTHEDIIYFADPTKLMVGFELIGSKLSQVLTDLKTSFNKATVGGALNMTLFAELMATMGIARTKELLDTFYGFFAFPHRTSPACGGFSVDEDEVFRLGTKRIDDAPEDVRNTLPTLLVTDSLSMVKKAYNAYHDLSHVVIGTLLHEVLMDVRTTYGGYFDVDSEGFDNDEFWHRFKCEHEPSKQ